MLDTGVLGMICHPRKHADVKVWFRGVVGPRRIKVYLPEIADYELRRELIRINSRLGLAELDRLPLDDTHYLPLDTATMRDASALWAQLQNSGRPVGAKRDLGADTILAAQARLVAATVVTENVRHLGLMVTARTWQDA